MNDNDRDIIAMLLSDAMFKAFGFGPSMSVCRSFVDQMVAEAATFGQTVRMRPADE